MSARFTIDHIAVTLSGVSPVDAATAAQSLEAALRDRLGGWRPEVASAAPLDLGDVDLGSVELSARLDAPTLATIVLRRLADRIEDAAAESGSAE